MNLNALRFGILLMAATEVLAMGCRKSDGLVLHYPFDVDEGRVLTDASGSGRFGWLHGGVWVADGVQGGAIRFESGDQYLVADDFGLPAGDAPRTMALWVKLDSLDPDPLTAMLTYGTEQWNRMSGIGMDWRVGRANFYFTQCGGVALSEWRMTEPGQWHHLAYVYEGNGQHRFFVDGVPGDGMSELWGPLRTVLSGAVIVGAFSEQAGPRGGCIDDVRIYGRALSAEEIRALAQRPEPVPEPVAGLVLHYTFDRDEDGIVTDDSGNGRTAVVNGATWVAEGVRGGAYRFDSNEQTILATDAGLPAGDSPRSIALWMKLDVYHTEMITGLLSYGTQGYNRQLVGIGYDWRHGRNRLYYSPGGACFLAQDPVPAAGTWIHLTYTYGGSNQHHLYVDGLPSDGMSELWGPVNTVLSGVFRLGGHPGDIGPLGGYLDDVRIYDRVLNAEEIRALAQRPAGSTAPDPVGPPVETGAEAAVNVPFELQRIAKDAAGKDGMVVAWASIPGRAYDVYWTDDLNRGFTRIAARLVADGPVLVFTNHLDGAGTAFYAVSLQDD